MVTDMPRASVCYVLAGSTATCERVLACDSIDQMQAPQSGCHVRKRGND